MLNKIKTQLAEGKTFLLFGFTSALGQALGMIAPLVIAKYFERDLFGSYSLAKMIVFFFTMLLVASLQMAFVVFANQEKTVSGKINKTFTAQCLFFLLSCILFVAAVGIFGNQLIVFAQITKGDLPFLLLAFLGLSVKSFLSNLFMAMDDRIKNSLSELVFGFFNVAMVIFFHISRGLNLQIVLSIYPLSTLFVLVFFLPVVKYKLLLPLKLERKYIFDMLSFTKWQFMGVTAIYFINWGDNLVLRYFVSMDEIGTYNLAYQFFKGLITLTSIVGFYFLPFVSQNINNSEKMRDYLNRKRPRIMIPGTIGIIIAAILSPRLLSLIYGDKFTQAGPILMLLTLGSICHLYNTFYHAVYNAAKLNKYVQFFDIAQVIINILLDIILIPYLGIMGAAIATPTAYIIRTIVLKTHFEGKVKKQLGLKLMPDTKNVTLY